jgi:single-stranded DNA-specific DHH superfamily exonuclease
MELEIDSGSIAKVKEFISKITKKDNVALISHIDLDGIAAAKIMSQVINPKVIKLVNYGHINQELTNLLKENKINKVITTDYAIKEDEIKHLEQFTEVLSIDHHQFEKDHNSQKTVFFNAQGYCAAYICYSLFQDNEKVKKLDWLAALASTVDWCYTKNKEFMEKTYEKYGDSFNIKDPRKGKFWDLIENFSFATLYLRSDLIKAYDSLTDSIDSMKSLDKYSKEVIEEFKSLLKRFDSKKQEIKEGYIYEIKSRFELAAEIATELSLKESDKIFIIIGKRKKECRGSARRQDKKINLPKLLQYAIEGFENSNAGGHIPSSGCSFPKKYLEEFKKRLKEVDLERFKID